MFSYFMSEVRGRVLKQFVQVQQKDNAVVIIFKNKTQLTLILCCPQCPQMCFYSDNIVILHNS